MSKVDLQRKSAYRDLLSDLTRNDRNKIQSLADVALDNKQHATAVADAIIDHIVMVGSREPRQPGPALPAPRSHNLCPARSAPRR